MKLLTAVIGMAGLLSIILVLLILARLTQKWELVTKLKSYYYLFYVSVALVSVASVARLIRIGYLDADSGPPVFSNPRSWFYLCFYYLPLAIGMTISLGVTWRNWGWLLEESGS